MSKYIEWAASLNISSGPFKVLIKAANMVDSRGILESPHKLSLILAQECSLGQLVIENHLNALITQGVIALSSTNKSGKTINTLKILT